MRVVWSPRAIRRVVEAADFIALDKPDAARRWAEATFAAVERLAEFPHSGRVVPELRRREIREVIHGSYRIIYRVGEEDVFILTVRHGAQRFDPTEIE